MSKETIKEEILTVISGNQWRMLNKKVGERDTAILVPDPYLYISMEGEMIRIEDDGIHYVEWEEDWPEGKIKLSPKEFFAVVKAVIPYQHGLR